MFRSKLWTTLALPLLLAILLASCGGDNAIGRPIDQSETPALAPPATDTAAPTAAGTPLSAKAAFVPTFIGDWPPAARAAWDKVTAGLAAHISVTVPVMVEVAWEPLDSDFIGTGGAAAGYVNFGAGKPDTWYPVALANQLAGKRLGDGPDIQVSMNSDTDWYFGGSPKTALARDQSDFVSTLEHEIIHGMGFLGSADMDGDTGRWGDDDGILPRTKRLAPGGHTRFGCVVHVARAGVTAPLYPEIYDRFVVNRSGQAILDTKLFPNPSPALGAQLTSGNLFWDGEKGRAANGSQPVKLYAPSVWAPGSSFSHLDDDTYDGGPDAILTSGGERLPNTDVGPRVLGILADMGWPIR